MRVGSWKRLGRRSLGLVQAVSLASLLGCQALPMSRLASTSVPTRTTTTAGPTHPTPRVAAQSPPPRDLLLNTAQAQAPIPAEPEPPLPEPSRMAAPELAVPGLPPGSAPATDDAENPPLRDVSLVKAEELQAVVMAELADPPRPAEPPKPAPEPAKVELPPPSATPAPPPAAPDPAPAPAPKSPEQAWRDGLGELVSVARAKLKEEPADPAWALRAKLLSWMAEPAIDPEPASAAQVETWRVLLRALQVVATEAKGGDNAKVPGQAEGKQIRAALTALEAMAPLEMTDLALCRKVNGFGDYERLEPATRKPGQAVVLYAELVGLNFEPMADGFRSKLSSRVELFAEGNTAGTPVWSLALGTAEDRCRRQRRDYYINNRFTLPENLKPGSYRLRSSQTDLISGRTVTGEATLLIQP